MVTASTGRGRTALAAAGLILVLFLVSLDQTIVGTAMPTVVTELNGLVSEQALDALSSAASALPSGDAVVGGLLLASREALSGAISNGFLFVLVASVFAVAAAVLMENIHLTEKPTAHNPPENLADEVAVGISTGTSTSLPREPRQNPTGEPGR